MKIFWLAANTGRVATSAVSQGSVQKSSIVEVDELARSISDQYSCRISSVAELRSRLIGLLVGSVVTPRG